MTEYQGHRSWNAWNVSLYIANEELLYRTAVRALRGTYDVQQATIRFLAMTGLLNTKTPDGAIYNWSGVKDALAGLEIEQKEHVA
jgi:hypothetical protein